MRRAIVLLAALWVALLGPVSAFAEPSLAMQTTLQNSPSAWPPAGMKEIYKEDFGNASNFKRKQNGPVHEGGYNQATGTWNTNPTYGRSLCIGQKGQGAEFFLDPQRCGDGTNGAITFTGDAMRISLRAPTAPELALLPSDASYGYCNFVVTGGTGGSSSTTLTISAVTSGTVCPWAGFSGTGTTGTAQVRNYGTGTGGTGTYTLATAQTIANGTTLTGTAKWPFVTTQLNSNEFLTLKPNKGFCVETRDKRPTNAGTWPVWWLWTSNGYFDVASGTYLTVAKAEIDVEHFQAAGKNDFSSELHWHTVAGGAYNASGTSTKTPYTLEGSYHVWRVCADLNEVDWYLDGIKVQHSAFPSNAVTWKDNFQEILFMLSACNITAAYCGVYDGTQADWDIDYIRVAQRNDAIGCATEAAGCDYMLSTLGDGTGLGAELIAGDKNLSVLRFPWSQFDNCTTTTTIGSVDSIPGQAVNIAVNGANADCARMLWGDTGAGLGVTTGHTYKITVKYNYGTSNSIKVFFGHESTSDIAYSATGTTPVAYISTCTSPTVTTVGTHKEFTCTYTVPSAGKAFVQVGPNSGTNGQGVDVYAVSVRDTTPLQ